MLRGIPCFSQGSRAQVLSQVLHKSCTSPVQVLYKSWQVLSRSLECWRCRRLMQNLYRHCTGIVQALRRHCTGTAQVLSQVLHKSCTSPVQVLYKSWQVLYRTVPGQCLRMACAVSVQVLRWSSAPTRFKGPTMPAANATKPQVLVLASAC